MDQKFTKNRVFPKPQETFCFQLVSIDNIKNDCLFVIDANVLLTPFTTGIKSLEAIRKVYNQLKMEDRIYVPAQAAREFLDNRATKLGDIHEALSKKMNQNFNYVGSHPLLAELTEHKSLEEKEKQLKDAIKAYRDEIGKVLAVVKSWGWNDPVSSMYQEVLSDRVLSDDNLDYAEISKDLDIRNELHIPPGYKDQSKDFNLAGDLVVWYEILILGEQKDKNVVFVSGEEKSDWWHKSGKDTLYPRFELVDEFRRRTNGKSFHIISLSRLLELFDIDIEVVEEVKREESYLTNISAQAALNNQALKMKTIGLINELRELLQAERYNSEILSNQRMMDIRGATTEEERQILWHKWNELDREPTRKLMSIYEKHKIDAILLRDELLSRLPESVKAKRSSHIAHMYEHPTNPLGLVDVLDDLEMLAKSLNNGI